MPCNICDEAYNVSDHKPLFLPCSNSMCLKCVEKWLETPGEKCFVCHEKHDGVKLEDLKMNNDLIDKNNTNSDPPGTSRQQAQRTQSSGDITILLHGLNGEKYPLKVPPSITIRTVKNLMKIQHNFNPHNTRIIYKGKTLEDYLTLDYYGVVDGVTLQLTSKHHGGDLFYTRDCSQPASSS